MKNEKTVRMMKSESQAAKILLDMGYEINDIARAIKNVYSKKSIRVYNRENDVVTGCLVAMKNRNGRVVFGSSVVHPQDNPATKRVTGLVASCVAILDPDKPLPYKISKLLDKTDGKFIDRCLKYFRANRITMDVIARGQRCNPVSGKSTSDWVVNHVVHNVVEE